MSPTSYQAAPPRINDSSRGKLPDKPLSVKRDRWDPSREIACSSRARSKRRGGRAQRLGRTGRHEVAVTGDQPDQARQRGPALEVRLQRRLVLEEHHAEDGD